MVNILIKNKIFINSSLININFAKEIKINIENIKSLFLMLNILILLLLYLTQLKINKFNNKTSHKSQSMIIQL
jgi:hypothetical protein